MAKYPSIRIDGQGLVDFIRFQPMTSLADRLQHGALLLDGGFGSAIQDMDLDVERDYLGEENCTEILLRSRPELVQSIHASFLQQGADAVETNTFGANQLVLAEFGLEGETRELNKEAAEIARAACESAGGERYVLGSIGPGTRLLTLGQTDWSAMHKSYRIQIEGLLDGGVDGLLVETCQDPLQIRCAVHAALRALADRGIGPEQLPIMVSVTVETTGTLLVGSEIAAVAASMRGLPVASLGLNCATGPAEMTPHVEWLSKHWDRSISVVPNAGLPILVDGRTEYPLQPEPMAQRMAGFVSDMGVQTVGGCCGTKVEHIAALRGMLDASLPGSRNQVSFAASTSSVFSAVEHRQQNSVQIVGERTNASGSRAFKRLLEAEDWDAIVELASEQGGDGSHVLDVNVDYAGRDNERDMREVVSRIAKGVDIPLMIDSTQVETIRAGLESCGGRAIVNSANLEEGEPKFDTLCALAREHGAAIVLGCIDDDPEEAMARTAERKLAIARRMYDRALEVHGFKPEDLFFDPLVLPISTGMAQDRRSGLETIEGVRKIAEAFPEAQITCGLSNVSFGLKPAARMVLNSVFLHELQRAGLTSAIMHASKILPRTRIEDGHWSMALDLIYDRSPAVPAVLADGTESDDPLAIFSDEFAGKTVAAEVEIETDLPLEDRLRKQLIDGRKGGLECLIDEALEVIPPLDIINLHLLDAMREVGELFGAGKMQLPFVLKSAEVMKAAVSRIEPHLDRIDGASKGSIVLATVKGDVHDIGKNLVDIILTNNGYTVHNIGIKKTAESIMAAVAEHQPHAIGLSGLLVKSVMVMESDLETFNSNGLDLPVMLGGAALSRRHCEGYLRPLYGGECLYAQDAFDGLRLMDLIVEDNLQMERESIVSRSEKRDHALAKAKAAQNERSQKASTSVVTKTLPVPAPTVPFLGTRVVQDLDCRSIWPYMNRKALTRGQWQLKRGSRSETEHDAWLKEHADPVVDRLSLQCLDEGILQPKVVYGWFRCRGEENDLVVLDEDGQTEIERFTFPRQAERRRLCISDFFGEDDVIGMSCVTVGEEATARCRTLFEAGDFSEYLYLHGFAVETAEALAEMWHKRMRAELGIDADDAVTPEELFRQQYRGSRYSFGYPACPDMSDQAKLFRLLQPERIGCNLTENFQIDPEQSTSAIVVHHPEAKYFAL